MIDKPNRIGIVAAGLAAGVLLAVCVQAYRHPVVRPIYRWVQVETEWAAPDTAFIGLRLKRIYTTRQTCEAKLPTNTLETIGKRTARHVYYCVRAVR